MCFGQVGHAFVQQYYLILHQSPALVHRFYKDISKLGRPEDDGTTSITTTMSVIIPYFLAFVLTNFVCFIVFVVVIWYLHVKLHSHLMLIYLLSSDLFMENWGFRILSWVLMLPYLTGYQ